jgi:hypothetical protein
LLYHTALQLQQSDFTIEADRQGAVEIIREVIYLFEGHAHTEDNQVFTLVQDVAPELVADFERQHVQDHELGEKLEQSLAALENASTDEEKIIAGIQLQVSFRDFTAFNLSHMNQEETLVNEKLWANYTDGELHEATMKIVGSIPPEKNARYSYWMLKGLSMTEIVMWYRGMKASVPSFVMGGMWSLAESALSSAKFKALREQVEPVEALAL